MLHLFMTQADVPNVLKVQIEGIHFHDHGVIVHGHAERRPDSIFVCGKVDITARDGDIDCLINVKIY